MSNLPTVLLGLASAALLTLGACKPKAPDCNPDDVEWAVRIVVQPTDTMNPDAAGDPLPTAIRLYQLKGTTSLEGIDFQDVWQQKGEFFGEELVSEDEFTAFPAKMEVREVKPEAEATHMLAVAIFQEHIGNTWFNTYEIPLGHGDGVCDVRRYNATKKKKKPKKREPEPPCFFLLIERSQIDGGHTPPPGFDDSLVDIQCPPPPPRKKKKKKKSSGGKKKKGKKGPEIDPSNPPEAPAEPTQPEAPSAPGGAS